MSCMGGQGACNGTWWITFQHCPTPLHHSPHVLSSTALTMCVPWTLYLFPNLVDLGLILNPATLDSNHEFTDSEGSSHDERTISAAVWILEFLSGNSCEGVVEGDVADTLFCGGSSQPMVDCRRASTSLFL